jgi:hypothetical protein
MPKSRTEAVRQLIDALDQNKKHDEISLAIGRLLNFGPELELLTVAKAMARYVERASIEWHGTKCKMIAPVETDDYAIGDWEPCVDCGDIDCVAYVRKLGDDSEWHPRTKDK